MDIDAIRDFVNLKLEEGAEIKRQRIAEQVSELLQGHALMDKLRKALATFDEMGYYGRSKDQVQMHNRMLAALAKLIYGPKVFDRYKREIMHYNGFTQISSFLACTLPRREGKTISLAQLITVLLLLLPFIKIAFVTNNMGNGELMTAKVQEFLAVVFNKAEKSELPFNNKRKIHLRHDGNECAKFMAFSGQGNPNK